MTERDRQLVDLLLDGDLPDSERAMLLARMEHDPEALKYLAERSLLHVELRRSIRRRASQQWALATAAPDLLPRNIIPFRRLPLKAMAAACAILLAMGGVWWGLASRHATGIGAEIIDLAGAQFAEPAAGFLVGEHRTLHSLRLRQGTVRLRLDSDVDLAIEGPADLRFVGPKLARLQSGKLTAQVGSQGKGFALETPQTRVVDLGTEFGVDARADGSTDVMVIKGAVDLFTSRRDGHVTPLGQGEAVRVDQTQAIERIVSITGGPQMDEWSTQPPAECNITSVSDNFGASEGFHFYRIVPHGLRPGAVVYTNRPHVWQPVEGKAFPPSLMNADVVQTFFGELKHRDYAIEIVVARPVELFVLMPRRGIVAPWLEQNFARTGEALMLQEADASHRRPPNLFFEVWKRTVSHAGKVILGPGNRDANGNPVGMYGIAAKNL